MNFIYVVQPFTQQFFRILNPMDDQDSFHQKNIRKDHIEEESEYKSTIGLKFEKRNHVQSSDCILFINDQYIIVANSNTLKYAKLEEFTKLLKSSDSTQAKKYIKYFKQYEIYSENYGFDDKRKTKIRGTRTN